MKTRVTYTADGYVDNPDGSLTGWCNDCQGEVTFTGDPSDAVCAFCAHGWLRPFKPQED